ncbi:MAG TPA: hypothetical protein VNZ44_12015, partial [Pyrinomonadaceae bacterium]|nr:hypothetical protein [Pyrinomonadaceae bacterium]
MNKPHSQPLPRTNARRRRATKLALSAFAAAPGETINCDHAPNTFFPVGTTEVKCTSSLGRECGFDVTVTDATPPSVTPPANIETGTDDGACTASVNPGTATASDACGVNVEGVRGDAQPLNAPYP